MNLKIKAVFADDNAGMFNELESLLELYRRFDIVARIEDLNRAFDYVMENSAEVLFVRYTAGNSMCSGDGAFLTAILSANRPDLLIAVYSDNPDDAYQAYNCGASVFFTVPVDAADFQRMMYRLFYLYDLIAIRHEAVERSLMVKNRSGIQIVKMQNILYIESSNRRKRIICADGKEIEILNYSMDELAGLLADGPFFRCYQSFIVNMEKISEIRMDAAKHHYSIVLEGYKDEIMLSRQKQKEIVNIMRQRAFNINL